MAMRRTTILLDLNAERAAEQVSAKLGITPSEVIRRALVSYRDLVVGPSVAFRKKRTSAFRQLSHVMAGLNAVAETKRIKAERRFF